jgi:hypothetical protein
MSDLDHSSTLGKVRLILRMSRCGVCVSAVEGDVVNKWVLARSNNEILQKTTLY